VNINIREWDNIFDLINDKKAVQRYLIDSLNLDINANFSFRAMLTKKGYHFNDKKQIWLFKPKKEQCE